MPPISDAAEPEVQALRRALSDMAALSSLPALWIKADAQSIAESLAAALVRVLDLDAVRVVLPGAVSVEETAASLQGFQLSQQLDALFSGRKGPSEDVRDLDGGKRALCLGVGFPAESRLYAVARRADFPTSAERLAIVTAANQAAVALRRAEVEAELRAQTEALNHERDAVAALNRRISVERDRLRLLFEQAPGFIAMLQGPEHIFELCNESYYRVARRRDILGRSAREVFPELVDQGFFELLDEVYGSGKPFVAYAAPIDLRDADGVVDRRYLDFVYQPVFDAEGRVTGIFAEGHDVTEQTVAAEHRQLLVNELNHRVKNTLATVQSLAHQTLRGATDLADAKATLTARLVSLSRAHDVLTRENWSGAEAAEIVAQAIRPHEDPGHKRFTARGPRVRLSARCALAVSMALHELATNAAKYGALSNDVGTVKVVWTLDEPARLCLEWREIGGPPLKETLNRQGFGSRLLRSGLAAELGAPAEIHHAPDGLICRIRAPVLAISDVPLAPAGPHPKAPQGRREAEHVAHLDVVPHGRP